MKITGTIRVKPKPKPKTVKVQGVVTSSQVDIKK